MGTPDEEENYIGPMARFDLRDELHQQVQATLPRGPRCCWAERKSAARELLQAYRAGERYAIDDGLPPELFGPVAATRSPRKMLSTP